MTKPSQASHLPADAVNHHPEYDAAYAAVKRGRPSGIHRIAADLASVEGCDKRAVALGLTVGLLICRHEFAFGMRLLEEREGIDDAGIREEIAQLMSEES